MASESAGVRVGHSPTRCPYCHDLVAAEASFVACAGCLAKHHAGCWRELGRCGTCGESRPLVPAEGAAPTGLTAAARPRSQATDKGEPGRRGLSPVALTLAILAALVLAAAVGFFGWTIDRASRENLERARAEARARAEVTARERLAAAQTTALAQADAKAKADAEARAAMARAEARAAMARAETRGKATSDAAARARAEAEAEAGRGRRPAPATPVPVTIHDHFWFARGEIVSAIGPWDPNAFAVWWSWSTGSSFGGDAESERQLILADKASDRSIERLAPEPGNLNAVALGAGDLAVVELPDHRLVRFSLGRHAEVDVVDKTSHALALALLPDGTAVVRGSEVGQVTVCDLGTGRDYPWREIRTQRREVVATAASPDSKQYASASADGTVNVWRTGVSLEQGALVASLVTDAASPSALAFLPDGKSLAVAYGDATLSIWDVASGLETRVLAERRGLHVNALAALPDGDTLVLGCDDRTVRTFSISKATELDRIRLAPYLGPALALGALPDGLSVRIATRSGIVLGLSLVTRDEYDGKKK